MATVDTIYRHQEQGLETELEVQVPAGRMSEALLSAFYQQVQERGLLRTTGHARRWSEAVLWTLGENLDRRTRKALADALPPLLARPLTRPFRLLPFRDPTLSGEAFVNRVARRGGNTDSDFARHPTMAVIYALKQHLNPGLSQHIARTLPPEVADLWRRA